MLRMFSILFFVGCASTQTTIPTPADSVRVWVVSDSLIGRQDEVTLSDLEIDSRFTFPVLKDRIENWLGGNWPFRPSKRDSEHLKADSMKRYLFVWSHDRQKLILFPSEMTKADAIKIVQGTTGFVE